MAPKSSNCNSAYKSKMKLDLEKPEHGQVEDVKVDLTKINLTIATQLGFIEQWYTIIYDITIK